MAPQRNESFTDLSTVGDLFDFTNLVHFKLGIYLCIIIGVITNISIFIKH